MKYILPAEWEKHEATLLSFPYEGKDWPGKYHAIKWAFIELIKKVLLYEKVILVVKDEAEQQKVSNMLQQAHANINNLEYVLCDANRNWMRDSGPIIVKNTDNNRIALQFKFTGWAKYNNYKKDTHIPAAVAAALNIPLEKAMYKNKHIVLEGGAIEVNGCGTLITTEECLLHPSIQVRNPGFTKHDYENVFNEFFGITNTIWLGKGITGDDTHGHIDDLCRFVNKNTVLTVIEENPDDENYLPLKENLERLKNAKLEDGSLLNIVTIPMPAKINFEDLRLPASYVNYLITNGCVFVPTFNDKNDRIALNTIADLFPDKDVVGISSIDLIWGLGTLHCLSHEISL